MKKIAALLTLFVFSSLSLPAQYDFKILHDCRCTSVKNQQRTGTCWSFSTVSFLESELLRMGKEAPDLSEMYVVRNIYTDKARNYIFRQGKANFGQGSLAHDVLRAYAMAGMVPESVYDGKPDGVNRHDHSEMESALKGFLDGLLRQKRLSKRWTSAFEAIMDVYLGPAPERFTYQGKSYTPRSFADELGIQPQDYVSFTSFTHHPFNETCILEIPDNYSNGSYYNLPFEELEAIVDYAISHDFTVAWDGDVSEKGFSAKNGIAVLPQDPDRPDLFTQPGPEIHVTQELRQETFMSFETTDDHLMHITGIAQDQNGTKYYLVKNSWGEISPFKGFLYMSAPYFRLKTIAITVHKDGIPPEIRRRLEL
ncbi:MAG: aminopeptidase [Bacteroidetes bacterium]|nr:MAG: aminopeptidase [Bacteroidota bacterium]